MSDLLLNDENHVLAIMHEFTHAQVRHMSAGFGDIIAEVARIRGFVMERVEGHGNSVIDWPYFYDEIGAKCLWELNDAPTYTMPEKFASFLMGKHKRYGVGSILVWKHLGILQRIDSKCQRIDNLSGQNDPDWGDESAHDNLSDILGYCILGKALIEFETGETR